MGSMVFRWFWGNPTIGNDGFRWFCTIGPTMEWLSTIVDVYLSFFLPISAHNYIYCKLFALCTLGPFSAVGSPTFADCSQIYVLLADDHPDESHQPLARLAGLITSLLPPVKSA